MLTVVELPVWIIVAAVLAGELMGVFSVLFAAWALGRMGEVKPKRVTGEVLVDNSLLVDSLLSTNQFLRVKDRAQLAKGSEPVAQPSPKKQEDTEKRAKREKPKKQKRYRGKEKPEEDTAIVDGSIVPVRITDEQRAVLDSKIASRGMYRASETAELLQVSSETIRRRIRSGKMVATLIDREYWIDPKSLGKWIIG